MASVRITHEIRSYVRNRIENLFRQRIEEKQKELDTLDIGTVCYEKYVNANARNLIAQLNNDPDGSWVDPTEHAMITMSYTGADGKNKTVHFTISFKPPVPLPVRLCGYNRTRFILREDMAPYQHAKKIWLEHDQLIHERDVLLQTIVDGVLNKCTTLRQVLEVWPTALDFMPDGARAQHYAKAEKRNSNPTADIEIDDDVKVSLMKARMLTAGG